MVTSKELYSISYNRGFNIYFRILLLFLFARDNVLYSQQQ